MVNRLLLVAIGVAMIGASIGCAGTQPIWSVSSLDENWGTSYETATYNQILDPDTGKSLSLVEGLDGPSVASVLTKYHKSFEPEKSQKSATVNLSFGKSK